MPRKKKSKMYFTEDTEHAIIEYNKSTDRSFRNKIYQERIQYPFEKLAELLQSVKGGETVVQIEYFGESAKATLRLGEKWRVETTDELLYELKIWLGNEFVAVF